MTRAGAIAGGGHSSRVRGKKHLEHTLSPMARAFYDRHNEVRRLRRVLESEHGTLAVVCGRRRCGESTLLHHMLSSQHVH